MSTLDEGTVQKGTVQNLDYGMVRIEATVQGTTVHVLRKDLDADDGPDPNFWDPDYTVAASTGMLMWEGSWAAVEL